MVRLKKKLMLFVLLAAVLTNTEWAMSSYLIFNLKTLEKDRPNFSIAGGSMLPRIPCFGMNALEIDVVSFGGSKFVEIGLGWGWNCYNSILMTGPALVGELPGWFGVVRFSSDKPYGWFNFYLKGSVAYNPCDRCNPFFSLEVRASLETWDCSLWGLLHYKNIVLEKKSCDFWDVAFGTSPLRFYQSLIYAVAGCDSWMQEPQSYVGVRVRIVFVGEIIGKAYLSQSYRKCQTTLTGFGLGFNFQI